jgi:uncharacterized membrane protein YidH (DUF202 family)
MTPPGGQARGVLARDRSPVAAVGERGPAAPADDIEDTDPGLARERTGLAWTRTAISFAALGGALLKTTPAAGALVLIMAVVIWGLGRVACRTGQPEASCRYRHLLITITVALVSLVALAVVLLAGSSTALLRPHI